MGSPPAVVAVASVLLVALAGNVLHVSNAFMLQTRTAGRHRPSGGAGGEPAAVARNAFATKLPLPACRWSPTEHRQRRVRRGIAGPAAAWTMPHQQRQRQQQQQRQQQKWCQGQQGQRGTTSMLAAAAAAADQVGPGSVVVFDTDVRGRPPALGLVTDSTMTKKKTTYTVQPAGGTGAATVAPRQLRYVVPGGSSYQASDLTAFEEEQEVDEGLMEEAWLMMLEETAAAATAGLGGGDAGAAAGGGSPSSDDPRGMAELLFGAGEPTPQQCYQAFRLLEGRDGALYFKRRRDGTYECRTRWGCAGVYPWRFVMFPLSCGGIETNSSVCIHGEFVVLSFLVKEGAMQGLRSMPRLAGISSVRKSNTGGTGAITPAAATPPTPYRILPSPREARKSHPTPRPPLRCHSRGWFHDILRPGLALRRVVRGVVAHTAGKQ